MALVLAEGQSESRQCWHYPGIPEKEEDFLEDIKQRKDPNFVNCYGMSALVMAVRVFQSPELVEKLLNLGADPNKNVYIGRIVAIPKFRQLTSPLGSPLHLAAWINDIKIIELLLTCRADPNAVSSFRGLTPLQFVIYDIPVIMGERPGYINEEGALNAIKVLIARGADVARNASLLHLAAERGYCSIVQHLLSYEEFPTDWIDDKGKTPLMVAVQGNFSETVQILVARGADLRCKDVDGDTSLHYTKNVEIARILLQHGADVNAKNKTGRTALHIAVKGAMSYELIKCLLEYEADVNVADKYGFRPLHFTVRRREETVDTSLIKILTDNGADPFLPDGVGRIPLSYFTDFHSDDVVRQMSLLLPESENTRYSTDIFGKPPLFKVLTYFMSRSDVLREELRISEFKDVIQAFLKSGMEINCQDIGGSTCLHVIAANDGIESYPSNRCSLIRELIGFGGDRNLTDVDGNSPAHIAAEKKRFDELSLLVADNWRDNCNLKGETVQGILTKKIRKHKECRDFKRFYNIVHDVQEMMEDLRLRETVKLDVVDTLNEKIPEAFKAIGFEDILSYPAPMVQTVRAKDVFASPEEENVVTNILQSIAEKKATDKHHENRSEDNYDVLAHRDHTIQDSRQSHTPVLWREGEACPVAVFADDLILEYVSRKRRRTSPENYIPPAPDAVKHLIRDLPEACRNNTVGEFHFGKEECSHERCEIGRQVKELVNDLVLFMEKLDPQFQCKLHLTGSVAEKTKLWKPDEFDFMMELTKLKGHCSVRFMYGRKGMREIMVVLDEEAKPMWTDRMKGGFGDSIDFLSPTNFRDYFVLLAWRAGFSLERTKYKNLRFSLSQYCDGRQSLPLIRFSQVGVLLHMQWHRHEYPSLDIEVDLTPAVPFSDWPEQLTGIAPSLSSLHDKNIGFHAITAITRDGAYWRLSFSVIELNLIQKLSNEQLDLYKALKLLRDIHMKEGATPSFALKSIVFNYIFKENASGEFTDLVFHAVHLLRRLERRRCTDSFFTNDYLPDVHGHREIVSTDWIRLSLLEFRKERIPSWFWLEEGDQLSYA